MASGIINPMVLHGDYNGGGASPAQKVVALKAVYDIDSPQGSTRRLTTAQPISPCGQDSIVFFKLWEENHCFRSVGIWRGQSSGSHSYEPMGRLCASWPDQPLLSRRTFSHSRPTGRPER